MDLSIQDKLRIDCKRCATPLFLLMILDQYGELNVNRIKQCLSYDKDSNDLLFTTNQLYNVLFNLEMEGLIIYRFGPGKQGSTCKYYRLTTVGTSVLQELIEIYMQTDRLFHHFLSTMQKKGDTGGQIIEMDIT